MVPSCGWSVIGRDQNLTLHLLSYLDRPEPVAP